MLACNPLMPSLFCNGSANSKVWVKIACSFVERTDGPIHSRQASREVWMKHTDVLSVSGQGAAGAVRDGH